MAATVGAGQTTALPDKRLLMSVFSKTVFSKTEEYTVKKGKIRDNALKAQLRTPMFKMQQQTPKKGKGSYSRKGKASERGHRQAA